ncbi:MAG TPA: IclR family transcriptional regulator [Acetobacteraceae bacterium]|nr:IclR family transcriptional regulator [Acetobacteraceae bacterium]
MGRLPSFPAFAPSAGEALAENAGDAAFASTLAKGLAVLEAFHAETGPLGNQELATRTGIPRQTVARLSRTLAELGYLRYDTRSAKYRPGPRALRLARPLLAGMTFRQAARPLMQQFAESVHGTVSIGVLDGTSAIYVETARFGDAGPHVPDIGMPIPVVCSAIGRAMAAMLPPAQRRALDEQIEESEPELWAAHHERYAASVRQCAERGFCASYGEWRPTIHAVASPLFARGEQQEVFALNCGLPAFRLEPGRLEADIGPRLRTLAMSIRTLVDDTGPLIAMPRSA